MTPSSKECNAFDKECHIKVKKLMSYQPRTTKTKKKKVEIDTEDVEPSDNSDAVYKDEEKVRFDYKQMAGGPSGDNPLGISQYVRTGSREDVNTDPNMVTKFGALDERYNLKRRPKKKSN